MDEAAARRKALKEAELWFVRIQEDRQLFEALPGMDCFIRTDSNGEVVEFILPMG